MGEPGTPSSWKYSKRDWFIAGLIIISYITLTAATFYVLPQEGLMPGVAVILAALFFRGRQQVPAAIIAAVATELIIGTRGSFLVLNSIAALAMGASGAYMLRRWKIDPIFRRDRDVFRLLASIAAVSLIWPPIAALEAVIRGADSIATTLLSAYVAMLSTLLVLTPFILRWFAKRYFSRPLNELLQTGALFAALIAAETAYFIAGIDSALGIPLRYFALPPLLIIALRLRPRFVTLALVMTALFAVLGAAVNPAFASHEAVFRSELTLIVASVIFLIITALEEHRRANANRLLSQVATLENAVTRISSESKAKNDFIAILAHELRNPLAPIANGIELLKLKDGRDPEERKVLAFMADGMETVRSLLNDLLDVSRISEGKISLNLKKMELEPSLRSAILSTEHHRKERHQSIIFKGAGAGLQVYGDAVRIEQVFSNLLTNASKYSNSGTTITLSERKDGDMAEIVVSDEGIGLDPFELRTIFLPFHQVEHGERSRDGLGIGLSLVQNFVQMHGGTVTAESAGRNKGSRFIVRLPLYRA